VTGKGFITALDEKLFLASRVDLFVAADAHFVVLTFEHLAFLEIAEGLESSDILELHFAHLFYTSRSQIELSGTEGRGLDGSRGGGGLLYLEEAGVLGGRSLRRNGVCQTRLLEGNVSTNRHAFFLGPVRNL